MFDKGEMRYKLAFVWFILFISLWAGFHKAFPYRELKDKLVDIELSIQKDDWEKAKADTSTFIKIYKEKKYMIQLNNSTEAFTSFEHSVGQLSVAVEHKKEAALEYVGGLKEMLNFVVKPFAGP